MHENYSRQMKTCRNWYCSWAALIHTNWMLLQQQRPPNNIVGQCIRDWSRLKQPMVRLNGDNVGNSNANTSMHNYPGKMVAAEAGATVVVCNRCTLCPAANDIVGASFFYFSNQH